MHAVRWIVVATISVTLCFANTFCFSATPMQQAEPPLKITITTAQATGTVGASMTWRVTLAPSGQQQIGSIELRPGDARIWTWSGIHPINTLTNTIVLNISAISLVGGSLTPIIEARYTVDGIKRTQIVVGNASVHVEPVEMRVDAGVVARQGTVRKGDRLSVQVWIRNRSPFTLTQVHVHGDGADLAWEDSITLPPIPANETPLDNVLVATVIGQHPQPQLNIQYAWTDGTGISHTQNLYASGEALTVAKTTIEEPWNIIIGVLTGALVTLIPAWIQEHASRKRQKEANWQHVYGLLRLMVRESNYAADNGKKVDLKPLETIFKEEGLFTALQEHELGDDIHNLWSTAKLHNHGLNAPGGAQRAEGLRKDAQKVKRRLQKI